MTFVDQEIAHIVRVMAPWLSSDLDTPVMGIDYWRRRLLTLLGQNHLTHRQLTAVDTLLRELDRFEALGRQAAGRGGAPVHARRRRQCVVRGEPGGGERQTDAAVRPRNHRGLASRLAP